MVVVKLFSKRQKELRGETPDVYSYDKIPNALRVQIVHIWKGALGNEERYKNYNEVEAAYRFIVETLCREYGVFILAECTYRRNYMEELIKFILAEKDHEKVLDVVELSFRYIDRITRDLEYVGRPDASEIADSAVEELNLRFKENAVGYQYEDGEIIRIDSQLLHAEVVKPAIVLLRDKEYAGAQEEFMTAFEHYKKSNHKEALNEALKAFESTMKTICEKKKWAYKPTDTSSKLIDICFEKGIIPDFWKEHMKALRALLEGGIPTGRNKLSGHGQGVLPKEVPPYVVGYVLHMTGAAIVFLVKAAEAGKK